METVVLIFAGLVIFFLGPFYIIAVIVSPGRIRWRKPDDWGTKIRSILATLVTSIVVLVLVFWSAWNQRPLGVMSVPLWRAFFWADDDRREILDELERYKSSHGFYPVSLVYVQTPDKKPLRKWLDPWGTPFYYASHDDSFEWFCLGRDGKWGGVGMDADIDLTSHGYLEVRPTLSQFLFESEHLGTVWRVAIIASFCAGATCFLASSPREKNRATPRAVIISASVAALFAVWIASSLMAIYLIPFDH